MTNACSRNFFLVQVVGQPEGWLHTHRNGLKTMGYSQVVPFQMPPFVATFMHTKSLTIEDCVEYLNPPRPSFAADLRAGLCRCSMSAGTLWGRRLNHVSREEDALGESQKPLRELVDSCRQGIFKVYFGCPSQGQGCGRVPVPPSSVILGTAILHRHQAILTQLFTSLFPPTQNLIQSHPSTSCRSTASHLAPGRHFTE